MNLFDRLLDSFSGGDLRRRVWLVASLGLALTLAAAAGGFAFLSSVQTMSIDATGKCSEGPKGTIELKLDKASMETVRSLEGLSVELDHDGSAQVPILVRSVDRETHTMEAVIAAEAFAGLACPPNRFGVKLILNRGPFWKLLWGGSRR